MNSLPQYVVALARSSLGSADTLQVSWNFGNGVTLPFQAAARGAVTAIHQYAAAGTYTVTLSVRDQNGAQTNVSGTVTVAANGLVTAGVFGWLWPAAA